MDRRRALAGISTTTIAMLAGCSSAEDLLNQVSEPSTQEVKDNAKQVPYEELYRNISDYESEPVYWPSAQINDIASGQDTKEYILTLPSGDFADSDILWGVWNGDPFEENDDVEVWGLVRGLKTYTSLTGEQTVPKIKIKAIQLR